MCSDGVSVWFACKLCKSFFLNADDFAYHKQKSHVQEFRSTKFIVFEEQTDPPASPPENWVSFLSPRVETQIQKILSSPPPPIATNVDWDTSNENVTTNPSEEFIEIDLKSNVFIVNNRDGGSYDGTQASNNCFELNSNFNPNNEADEALFAVDIQEIDHVQSSIAPKSTDSDLSDKNRDKQCSSRTKTTIKSTTNNLERSNQKIPNVASKKALLHTVIQSPNNPYVCLERLNLMTIQNASSLHCKITIDSQENDKSNTNHTNSRAKSAKQPEVKNADQKHVITSNSTFPSTTVVTVTNCKFCSEHFNSTAELHIHEDICRLRSQFKNILCVPCRVTFASSDELIEHNNEFHFTSISNPIPETIIGHSNAVADDLEVAPKKQIKFDILPNVSNTSSLTKIPLSIKTDDHGHNIDFNPDLDFDAVSNADNNYSGPQNPNLNYGELVEVVKTENLAYENEDCELPSATEDHDHFESVSTVQVESSVEPTLNLSSCSPNNSEVNHHELLIPQPHSSGYFCISCQKNLISATALKIHNRTHHGTQAGKRNFTCPHLNCGKTCKTRHDLRCHVMQVHSIIKSFKCPYPNCGKAFKRPDHKNQHYKLHFLNTSTRKVKQASDGLETRNVAESSSSLNILDKKKQVLSKRSSQFRYCFSCKKYFPNFHELRNHNQTYHMTIEGELFFNCPYPNCERAFKTRGNLKTHLKLSHSKD